MRRLASLALVLALAGCPTPPDKTPPKTRTYTFHALSGISMGAIGTAFLAGSGDHWKRLDAIATMGGPLDAGYFLGRVQHLQLGGFCPYDKLVEAANDTAHPNRLNDPTDAELSQCSGPEKTFAYELPQDFNHWRFTTNGGHFDRSAYLNLFFDLSLAMGNPGYYNPDSAVFPTKEITQANFDQLCDHPVVLQNFYNKEFNPEGKYPVITFCDGQAPVLYCDDANKTPYDYCSTESPQEFCVAHGGTQALQAGKGANENPDLYYARAGVFDPCYHATSPVSFGLAVDFNGNGKRDYFEPVVANGHERFSDVGVDGCADANEDGKGGCTATNQTGDPNHDNFDPTTNPLGTEGDFRWEKGEPFEDNGLDGVPNTHDFGEGDGKYSQSPVLDRWFATDFRTKYLANADLRAQVDVYADGGVRDLFNFGLQSDVMTSATRGILPTESTRFDDFSLLPEVGGGHWEDGGYDPMQVDYDALGRNTFIRYGTVNATPEQIRDGDGDHVGTPEQVVERYLTFAKWMSHHWERALGEPEPVTGAPRVSAETFFSNSLKAPRNFDIGLPPGYDDPANKDERYPVVFMLHGYGMDPDGMASTNVLVSGLTGGEILPMIFVYPSGRCCHVNDQDGSKDCREVDDDGNDLDQKAGWHSECRTGSFFVDRAGFTPGDDTKYGESLFELMDYVDQHYRTLAPVKVPVQSEK